MKNPSVNQDKEPLELNLTSMIDVIFLLLIFFVCTASFREPEKTLPTNLAVSGVVESKTIPQEERDLGKIVVRILVNPTGRVEFAVDGKRVPDLDAVKSTLAALQEIANDTPVVVAPEPDVPIETVLDVYDSARSVGLSKIKFAASPDARQR